MRRLPRPSGRAGPTAKSEKRNAGPKRWREIAPRIVQLPVQAINFAVVGNVPDRPVGGDVDIANTIFADV